MKQREPTTWKSRQVGIILTILFIITSSYYSTAQNIKELIKANHKVYAPKGKGPFPLIIAIPGCSGVSLNGSETDEGRQGREDDKLFRRHYPLMANKLKNEGYMVLLVDYLEAISVINTCNGEIPLTEVSHYIKGSINFAKTIVKVDTSKIFIIGWSYGGAGTLTWLSDLTKVPIGVQAVITIYPGCGNANRWNSAIPVLMLLGEADDIAPPENCIDLVQSLPPQTNVKVRSYSGARHGFDLTEGPSVEWIGKGLSIGRNEQAGNEAWNEIISFLNEKK